ncbi:alpha/beta fold hydrolase [Belliella marina]|uniref:Alpha/beta fold hydrolase n=1 Tax=Belliella marina TaxID=1644146 RepID=A0ABW4VQQ7_9BACT
MPTDLQEEMAKNLNATKIETVYSGHLPMMSKPIELTKIIKDFIESLKS